MDEIPLPIPKSYPKRLAASILPDFSFSNNILELKITTSDNELSARDMSAYLALIDHIYGRLNVNGFINYSRSPKYHLRIKKVNSKCLEFIFSHLPDKSDMGIYLIIFLFLKYLPNAYQKYEEGRFTRMRRKLLKNKMREEKEIRMLDNRTLNNLIKLLDYLNIQEIRLIPRASRFASLNVKNIEITITSTTEIESSNTGGESESRS
jgi:hypothetical protein